MSTCGDCKHYRDNTCYSLAAVPSLLDMFYVTTPACEHFFEQRPEPAPAPTQRKAPEFSLESLSPETKAKLNLPRRRDWHQEQDR